jgi:hypothetical protein
VRRGYFITIIGLLVSRGAWRHYLQRIRDLAIRVLTIRCGRFRLQCSIETILRSDLHGLSVWHALITRGFC